MAGLGKMLKEAKKMQAKMEKIQDELAGETIDISHAGGAIKVSISCASIPEVQALTIDPDFLKEDADMVSEALQSAINEAISQAQKRSNDAMSGLTGGLGIPGF